jgi:iron-sulfur cluster assembly accessory protein
LEFNQHMAIILTETAAEEIKRYREAQKVEEGTVLRMGVAGGGCSGLQYTLGLETDFDPVVDARYEQHGVAIVTSKKMALHLDGTTIDFQDGPKGRGFSIDNPNVPRGGGCPGCGHH